MTALSTGTPMLAVLDDAIQREKVETFAAQGQVRPPETKIAVVTGGTRGVGREIVRGLCATGGYRVLVLGRDSQAGGDVCAGDTTGNCEFLHCDLSSLAAVYSCGEQIQRTCARVHLLVNCAGIVGPAERTETVEGNEVTLATNVLGPHLLTTLLLEQLEADWDHQPGRVINVVCEFMGGLDIGLLQLSGPNYYSARRAYRASKQAICLLSWALDRRLRERFSNITVNTYTPGPCDTAHLVAMGALRVTGKAVIGTRLPPSVGAETALALAETNNGRAIVSGYHWRGPGEKRVLPAEMRDAPMGERLW